MSDAGRFLADLPAVFRARDEFRALAQMLGPLDALFFASKGDVPGYEEQLQDIPALFAPSGLPADLPHAQTPEPHLGWLADMLCFTPHALFAPAALRQILAGIMPMHGRRGTRPYLRQILTLCFGPEIASVRIEDRPRPGMTVGVSTIGIDTRLGASPPFFFEVAVEVAPTAVARRTAADAALLREQLCAVIDFAKPAHTSYALTCDLG